MRYPNQIMRLSELVKMGYSKHFLTELYNTEGQKVAWKSKPGKNNPIYFDTEELEKIRVANCGI
jgi:hypothetical protein